MFRTGAHVEVDGGGSLRPNRPESTQSPVRGRNYPRDRMIQKRFNAIVAAATIHRIVPRAGLN